LPLQLFDVPQHPVFVARLYWRPATAADRCLGAFLPLTHLVAVPMGGINAHAGIVTCANL
jgi:hypothetical protein